MTIDLATDRTRRPTAKQREYLLRALADDALQAQLAGLQFRTVEAMREDGWISVSTPDGAPVDGDLRSTSHMLGFLVGEILLPGAVAVGGRIEWDNKSQRMAAGRAIVEQAAEQLGVDLTGSIDGFRVVAGDANAVEPYTAPAGEFTHTCDRCKRRFAGVFPTWNDRCGICHHGTINGAPPHMGGLYFTLPGEDPLPVHYKVPNTVGAACDLKTDETARPQMTSDMRGVTCPACLDTDLDDVDGDATGQPAAAAAYRDAHGAPLAVGDVVNLWQEIRDGSVSPVTGVLTVADIVAANGPDVTIQVRDGGAELLMNPTGLVFVDPLGHPEVVFAGDVDPAPGSVADLVALVELYGDARAAATEALLKTGVPEWEQHERVAADHLQRIGEIARALDVDGLPPALVPIGKAPFARIGKLMDRVCSAAVVNAAQLRAGTPAAKASSAKRLESVRADVLDTVGSLLAEFSAIKARPAMTRKEAGDLVDRLVHAVAADVEADAEVQSDDTVGLVEAIVTALAGPAAGDDPAPADGLGGPRRGVDPAHRRAAAELQTVELPAADVPVEQPVDEPVVEQVEQQHAAADEPDTDWVAELLAGAVAHGTPDEHTWVYTFGPNHIDPVTGESLGNCYVALAAPDRPTADRMMFDRYVDEWAFGYSHASAVAMLAKFPDMRNVALAPELPVSRLFKLGLGINGYALQGENGVTLFRATWVKPGSNEDDVEVATELPGLSHSTDTYDGPDSADAGTCLVLQKWLKSTLGVRRRVAIVDKYGN